MGEFLIETKKKLLSFDNNYECARVRVRVYACGCVFTSMNVCFCDTKASLRECILYIFSTYACTTVSQR